MDIQNLLAELRAEFSRINHAITVLEGLYSSPPRRGRPPKSKISAPTPSKKRPTMSAAARKRISEAMKQRWVKWKGKSAPKQVKAAPKKPTHYVTGRQVVMGTTATDDQLIPAIAGRTLVPGYPQVFLDDVAARRAARSRYLDPATSTRPSAGPSRRAGTCGSCCCTPARVGTARWPPPSSPRAPPRCTTATTCSSCACPARPPAERRGQQAAGGQASGSTRALASRSANEAATTTSGCSVTLGSPGKAEPSGK